MGRLDGYNILRYGHMFDSGGGMEQYVSDLNQALGARSAVNIIQVQLTSVAGNVGEAELEMGMGRFLRVSLFVEQSAHELGITNGKRTIGSSMRAGLGPLQQMLFAPPVYSIFTRHALKFRRARRFPGEPDHPWETVARLHDRFPLDLICLHSAGGADVEGILEFAESRRIPTVYVHHFSNDRLSTPSVGRQLERIQGIAGVAGSCVPARLRDSFCDVSDGIDVEFFSRCRVQTDQPLGPPVIFLPARITPKKGQAELIKAAGILKRRGIQCRVVLAGRTDNAGFMDELRELTKREGLTDSVEFTGNLDICKLREWYARAAIVGFPTRHPEGLGRILLECQAMEVPPVVYNIGGTPDGLKDGETGFLVRLGDFDGFVERISELLSNETRRRQMASAARRFVLGRFSLEALATRHEQFYAPFLQKSAERS